MLDIKQKCLNKVSQLKLIFEREKLNDSTTNKVKEAALCYGNIMRALMHNALIARDNLNWVSSNSSESENSFESDSGESNSRQKC